MTNDPYGAYHLDWETEYRAYHLDAVLLRVLALPFAIIAGALWCAPIVLNEFFAWFRDEA